LRSRRNVRDGIIIIGLGASGTIVWGLCHGLTVLTALEVGFGVVGLVAAIAWLNWSHPRKFLKALTPRALLVGTVAVCVVALLGDVGAWYALPKLSPWERSTTSLTVFLTVIPLALVLVDVRNRLILESDSPRLAGRIDQHPRKKAGPRKIDPNKHPHH
jgi:sterol desaturase/sphingolipid hydroxylase (fatty acid hydroxylase superfamily)